MYGRCAVCLPVYDPLIPLCCVMYVASYTLDNIGGGSFYEMPGGEGVRIVSDNLLLVYA